MRQLVHIDIPLEPFNSLVKEGKAGPLLGRLLETTRPEHIFFTEQEGGTRGAVAICQVEGPADVVRICEPWFLALKASCRFRVAISPEDLQQVDLGALGKSW